MSKSKKYIREGGICQFYDQYSNQIAKSDDEKAERLMKWYRNPK